MKVRFKTLEELKATPNISIERDYINHIYYIRYHNKSTVNSSMIKAYCGKLIEVTPCTDCQDRVQYTTEDWSISDWMLNLIPMDKDQYLLNF